MTRYLVTGATGFVGGHLTREILARGGTVTALVRRPGRAGTLRDQGVRVVEGDLATGRGLGEASRGADRVIHLAAVVKARTDAEFWAVNRDGTARLVRALAAMPVPPRLVVCSSLAAAGPARGSGPVSVYGASKLAAEHVVRAYAHRVPAVILRPGIVHGPGEPALVPALLRMIRLGLVPKPGFGPRRYGMIHVDDLCAALLAAAERGTTVRADDPDAGVHPLSDGVAYRWQDICAAVAEAAGLRAPVVLPVPVSLLAAVAALTHLAGRLPGLSGDVPALNRDKVRELRHADWTCTPAGARHDLGFTPTTSLLDGLEAALRGPTPSEAGSGAVTGQATAP